MATIKGTWEGHANRQARAQERAIIQRELADLRREVAALKERLFYTERKLARSIGREGD